MKNAIEEVRDLLNHLPEDADFETIIAKLYFKMQVYKGLDDIENGRLVDDEEIEKEFG